MTTPEKPRKYSCAVCTRPVFKPGIFRLCLGCRTFDRETHLTMLEGRAEAGALWAELTNRFPERTFRIARRHRDAQGRYDLFIGATTPEETP